MQEIIRYKLIRSNRKTLSMEIGREGLVVRSPMRTSKAKIDEFVSSHRSWIEKHMKEREELLKRAAEAGCAPNPRDGGPDKIGLSKGSSTRPAPFTKAEIEDLAKKALEYIPARCEYYAPIVGVSYGRITIRNQRTKWGSCSSKGNLNFNCLLMLMPPEVIDSVVVHELCHLKEMNHSRRFYAEVLKAYPEYKKWNEWLKTNGRLIMERNR